MRLPILLLLAVSLLVAGTPAKVGKAKTSTAKADPAPKPEPETVPK